MRPEHFFSQLWNDYVRIAPGVERIHRAVAERGERIVNDHVAFRTYDLAPINLKALENHLFDLGYNRYAPYEFPAKKLRANGYINPGDPEAPRVFLSELKTAELSPAARKAIEALVAQVQPGVVRDPAVMWSGPLWKPVEFETYEMLAAESEYAGWVAAFGIRANHFTISVNDLETMETLEELLDFVESLGYELNTAGGRVKGSPEVLLEQGSTIACHVPVKFAGGRIETIPSCYYEFARRYPDPKTGRIYDGFVAASADKIFESTDRRS